jgi:protein-S-isoprenylcysteine O-methyltransferase Ste14
VVLSGYNTGRGSGIRRRFAAPLSARSIRRCEVPEASDRETLDHANVIVMPPLLHLGSIVLGVVAHWFLGVEVPLDPGFRAALGVALLGGGVAVAVSFPRAFRRAGQDPNPNTPTPRVITTGLYRYSRNPAYASLVAVQLGIGLLLNNAWVLLVLIPVLVTMHYGVIIREEAYLERKFGDEYLRYKETVRRWL